MNKTKDLAQYRKDYYLKNKERIKAKSKEWIKNNKERAKKARNLYYIKNKVHFVALMKLWSQKNPRKIKGYSVKKGFNISLDEYEELFHSQGGMCAICKKQLVLGKKSCLDHNHSTGELRGFLCHGCNRGIGFFEDNIGILESAILYLRKF